MNDTTIYPRVTGSPETIWLNYGDLESDDTHANCVKDGEVTWCEDAVFVSDVKYVRADRIEQLEADSARLDRIEKALFQHQWNGVVGAGAKTCWRLVGDYRHTVAKMEGKTFREAIDAITKGEKT